MTKPEGVRCQSCNDFEKCEVMQCGECTNAVPGLWHSDADLARLIEWAKEEGKEKYARAFDGMTIIHNATWFANQERISQLEAENEGLRTDLTELVLQKDQLEADLEETKQALRGAVGLAKDNGHEDCIATMKDYEAELRVLRSDLAAAQKLVEKLEREKTARPYINPLRGPGTKWMPSEDLTHGVIEGHAPDCVRRTK